VSDNGATNHYYMLGLFDLLGGDDSVAGFVIDGGAGDIFATASTVPTTEWHHAAVVFTNPTTRKAYYDGTETNSGTSTAYNPTGENAVTVGALWASTVDFNFNGHIAEPTIWTAALTDEEIEAMANGVTASQIRPQLQWMSLVIDDGISVPTEAQVTTNTDSYCFSPLTQKLFTSGTGASAAAAAQRYAPHTRVGFVGPL
jgi:hypothetical protein